MAQTITTLAGRTRGFADGMGDTAQFDRPQGVAVSPDGTTVYVADWGNDRIRKISLGTTSVESNTQSISSWSVSPNPAASNLQIGVPEEMMESTYSIHNYLGAVVLSGTIHQTENLDISALPAGVYFICVGASAMPLKFVKH